MVSMDLDIGISCIALLRLVTRTPIASIRVFPLSTRTQANARSQSDPSSASSRVIRILHILLFVAVVDRVTVKNSSPDAVATKRCAGVMITNECPCQRRALDCTRTVDEPPSGSRESLWSTGAGTVL